MGRGGIDSVISGLKWKEAFITLPVLFTFLLLDCGVSHSLYFSSQASPSVYWMDREWTGGLAGLVLLFGCRLFLHHS